MKINEKDENETCFVCLFLLNEEKKITFVYDFEHLLQK